MSDNKGLKVLIVAEHVSAQWGGESILPLHYFRLLRARGVETWMVVHERAREAVDEHLPNDRNRVHYVPDTITHRLIFKMGSPLPTVLRSCTSQLAIRVLTQIASRKVVRQLIEAEGIDVIHQPTPVSPKESSLLHGLGAPVVIGPMNGGMSYPSAFRSTKRRAVESLLLVGRWWAQIFNRIMPGKLRAETLLVANDRTGGALPRGVRGRVLKLVENGVDLSLWSPKESTVQVNADRPVRFLFSGRLVEWKGVELLLQAFAQIASKTDAKLDVIGDGDERAALTAKAQELGLSERVTFLGWMAQSDCAKEFRKADVFVLPSLFECGGAVVLEAMATGLPVIATDWGGPADYLDKSCGILVSPNSRQGFVDGLAEAMFALATDSARRESMGAAGREKVAREYDWQRKIDRILEVYRETAGKPANADHPRPTLEVVVKDAPRRSRPLAEAQVQTTK